MERKQMTTTEHLEKIKAKCEANIVTDAKLAHVLSHDVDQVFLASAIAGWRSTIAAIDLLRDMGEHDAEMLSANIITDWPEELL